MKAKSQPRTRAAARAPARPVMACRVCSGPCHAEDAVALWREDELVFAICRPCMDAHDIVMRPSLGGVEIDVKRDARLQVPEARRVTRRSVGEATRRVA